MTEISFDARLFSGRLIDGGTKIDTGLTAEECLERIQGKSLELGYEYSVSKTEDGYHVAINIDKKPISKEGGLQDEE